MQGSTRRLAASAAITTPQQRALDQFIAAALDIVNVPDGAAADKQYTDLVLPLLAALDDAAFACHRAGLFRDESEPF